MRTVTTLAGIVVVASVALHGQQQLQLYAGVIDATGMPPAALALDDVRVTENDTALKVLKVEPVDRKVSVQLLVDNGVGLGSQNLTVLRNGVRALIEALPADIETTLVTTAPQPRFVVRATTDRQALLQGVGRLTPDTGGGMFLDSLSEATQRIERDPNATAPVIVAVGTTIGDTNVIERRVEQVMQRLQSKPTIVHVVLLGGVVGIGTNQVEVGMAVAKLTGGRYESINIASRLATLLPEIGTEIAKAARQQGRHFRLTLERPADAPNALGQISAGARAGLTLVGLSMDGRLR